MKKSFVILTGLMLLSQSCKSKFFLRGVFMSGNFVKHKLPLSVFVLNLLVYISPLAFFPHRFCLLEF